MLNLTTYPKCGQWVSIVRKFFERDKALLHNIQIEYEKNKVVPSADNLFRALELTSLGQVKVVILGQDPYPRPGDADGLAFSTKNSKLPPTLKNIFKELKTDLNIDRNLGDLSGWASQGILLLNSSLTTLEGKIGAHEDLGWDRFVDYIIDQISFNVDNVVFILWGKEAQKKEHLINQTRHLVLKSSHPSPLSAKQGFFGSKPFSRANIFLNSKKISPIDWSK